MNPVIVYDGKVGLLHTLEYYEGIGVSTLSIPLSAFIYPRYGLVYPIEGIGLSYIDTADMPELAPVDNTGRREFVVSPSGRAYVVEQVEEGDVKKPSFTALLPLNCRYLIDDSTTAPYSELNAMIEIAKDEEDINRLLEKNLVTKGRLFTWYTVDELMTAIRAVQPVTDE